MSGNHAESVGRTLALLTRLRGRGRSAAEPSPDTRTMIVDLLVKAGTPLGVEELSAQTGLHANTVRTHLDLLTASGRVVRTQGPPRSRGRGRPPWLYSAADAEPTAFEVLAESLAEHLEQADDQLASEAAARWRSAATETRPAATPDEAVQVAVEAFRDLGFVADVSPVGDQIALTGCPYASLVADYPVICDVHAEAAAQVLAETGQGVTLAGVDVWARPGLCVARLNRPDLQPTRTVTPAQADTSEKKRKRP